MLAGSPAFIAIVGRMFRVERVGSRGWTGIALQLAGIAFVVFGSVARSTGDDSLLGSSLIVAGSLCWAFFAILIKPYTERLSGINVGAYSLAGGAVFVTVIGIPQILATEWSAVPFSVWTAIIYSITVSARLGRHVCPCSAIFNHSLRSASPGSHSVKCPRFGRGSVQEAS
jgi:drug/metabolite transporter (DMT)-like permease